jgi:hypothetical protein
MVQKGVAEKARDARYADEPEMIMMTRKGTGKKKASLWVMAAESGQDQQGKIWTGKLKIFVGEALRRIGRVESPHTCC